MANEITLNARLDFASGSITDFMELVNVSVDATTALTHIAVALGAAEQALDLGGVSTPGYMIAVNHGTGASSVFVRPSTGADNMIEIPAGGLAFFKFASDTDTPYVIGDEGNPVLEYMLIEA